jgi:hypothetical protein
MPKYRPYRLYTGPYRPKMNHVPTRKAKNLHSPTSPILTMLSIRFK